MPWRLLVLVAALLLWRPPSCEAASPESRTPVRAVVSIPPLAFLLQEIGDDLVRCATLLPPGSDPHGYEPGAREMKEVARAEVCFLIGMELDEWAVPLVQGGNPKAVIEIVGDPTSGTEARGEVHDHGIDPHIWLNPPKSIEMLDRMARRLAALRPAASDSLGARLVRTTRRLEEADRWAAGRLGPVRRVPFAALHGGLSSLVERYGLSQIGVLELSPGTEPGLRHLAGMVGKVRASGAVLIFVEPLVPARLAESVAREAGVPTVALDPLGSTFEPGTRFDLFFRAVVDSVAGSLLRTRRVAR